ncbi:transposase [Streptomyces sp. MBT84]|uniref:transposase n=1 Tax=Streptomyces sp. MBT84 TaxID=1488414 RepID=UPI0035ABD3A2
MSLSWQGVAAPATDAAGAEARRGQGTGGFTDSTPVPCGTSRLTVQRSNLAGWAGYGYCASHSRFFWGLRLYLVCTPTGMPIMWALANPKIGEREVLAAILEVDAALIARREGILLISDKGFASRPFEKELAVQGIELVRPSLKREKKRYGEPMLKKVRQLIESVTDTLKGQLDLEQHGGRTFEGVAIRVAQRILAMAAGIWHNNKTGARVTRSLVAYDH